MRESTIERMARDARVQNDRRRRDRGHARGGRQAAEALDLTTSCAASVHELIRLRVLVFDDAASVPQPEQRMNARVLMPHVAAPLRRSPPTARASKQAQAYRGIGRAYAYVPVSPYAARTPDRLGRAGNATDEGYGRYRPCSAGRDAPLKTLGEHDVEDHRRSHRRVLICGRGLRRRGEQAQATKVRHIAPIAAVPAAAYGARTPGPVWAQPESASWTKAMAAIRRAAPARTIKSAATPASAIRARPSTSISSRSCAAARPCCRRDRALDAMRDVIAQNLLLDLA
jgi:hypothetical protein